MPHGFETCLGRGVALFNAGAFHAAHEAWEEAWLHERGERRLLLQGLILVAAGWLKRDAGNPHGAGRLFSRASERLGSLPGDCEGMNVDGLRREVATWREGGGAGRPSLVWRGSRQEGEH